MVQVARHHLRATGPAMRSMVDAVGPRTLRFEKDRFRMLVRSIVSRQISTFAALAIRQRWLAVAGPEGLRRPAWPGSPQNNCGRWDYHSGRQPALWICRAK